jgi:hypothetical protein
MIRFQAPDDVALVPDRADVPARMAGAMRELAFSGATVDREALALRGFTSASWGA